MRESSRNKNVEEKLNKKEVSEPYADLQIIADLKKEKKFGDSKQTSIINPRMGIISTDLKSSPKEAREPNETSKRIDSKKEELKEQKEVENTINNSIFAEPHEEGEFKAKETIPEIQDEFLIEEQVEDAVTIPKMPARMKKTGVIEIKKINGAPKKVSDLNPDIRTIVAKGLADGVKIYLIELGVYDVNRGYNASKLPHEITNFIRQTNNNRFNANNLAMRLGVNLNEKHEELEAVKTLSYKDLLDEIGEDYPKSQIIRTTEDILSRDNNRFTLFEKKKMEELFEINGMELPEEE